MKTRIFISVLSRRIHGTDLSPFRYESPFIFIAEVRGAPYELGLRCEIAFGEKEKSDYKFCHRAVRGQHSPLRAPMPRPRSPAKLERLRPNNGHDRRAAILQAARALVTQVGFREAQVTAVADAAGVALGTLYRHFPSKAALMVEVVGLVAQKEVDVAAGIAMREGGSVERLSAAAWTFASRALRGRRMAHALVAEPVEPEIEAARLRYHRQLARVFETIIEQGIRDKEMPAQDVPASAACIVGCLFEGLVGPLANDALATDADRYAQASSIVGFCVRGVCGRNETFTPEQVDFA